MVNEMTTRSPALPQLAPRDADSHKGDYGRVLLIGGSPGMAGSISLSASASIRSGAGLVTVAVPRRCLETVAGYDRCYMTVALPDDLKGFYELAASRVAQLSESATVLGCGPGMRTGVGAEGIVKTLCSQESEKPLVFDADALNCLSQRDDWKSMLAPRMILTPHPGEWERLSGVAASDRKAQEAAAVETGKATGATIVLKGSKTFVTDGKKSVHNSTGNPGMASGGSGDVLTGVLCGLLAQGLAVFEAAHLGVFVHGRAGDLAAESVGQISLSASDLLQHLPAAFMSLSDQ